jgi:hypothetical protein
MKPFSLKFGILFIAILVLSCNKNDEVMAPTLPQAEQAMTSSAGTNSAKTFNCKNILIDASRDGGVWWFPQASGFNTASDHQGKMLAELLRKKGFTVDELPRGAKIKDGLLKDYSIIIRVTGFGRYEPSELDEYKNALDRGIALILLADHTKYSPIDDLAVMLDVQFHGTVNGLVNKFADHVITKGMTSFEYMVGSVITNAEQNKNIHPIGWLADGSIVMGILDHPTSNIFLMGDVNSIEVTPERFENNLFVWLESACAIQ